MSNGLPADATCPTPNPVFKRDAAALVGVLSVMEGVSLAGGLEPGLAERLVMRLHRDGLLGDDQTHAALRSALNGLNQRLRFALGESASDPTSHPGAD